MATRKRKRGGEWTLQDAYDHLTSVDERFIPIIQEYGQQTFYRKKRDSSASPFYELTKIIVFQQLSGSIADKILHRVLDAFGAAEGTFTPDMVLNAKQRFEPSLLL